MEITERAVEAEKSFFALGSLGGAVVHVIAKLDVGIERAGRPAPAECNVRSELGADHVAHDQRAGVEPIRWERAELVLPQPHDPPGPHFQRDKAERRWRV